MVVGEAILISPTPFDHPFHTHLPKGTAMPTEPETTISVTFTNNRMEDSRWNQLLTILFTPQVADPEAEQPEATTPGPTARHAAIREQE